MCKLNWDVGFVTFTMQEIGVQLPRLLEVYDQLFKARVRGSPLLQTQAVSVLAEQATLVLSKKSEHTVLNE